MLKNIALMIVGLGILPLTGCMSGAADESVQAEEAAVTSCSSQAGLFPTIAGLAVAMGDELGRWDPLHDLAVVNGAVALSSTAHCLKNNCANTKALLGQQNAALISVVDQNVFSPQNYASNLNSGFDRQKTLIANLTQNHPTQLPPAHKLTKVGGPVNLGTGACGAHFVFQADHLDGTALKAAEATNMVNTMAFYGFGNGGSNPFIAFTVTGQGCPSGRTCIAIDPTDSDNGKASQTGQAAVMYPLNRLYDPASVMLGQPCITTASKAATMVNKCSAIPSTCGFLYCVAN
jgi:hypothetical protein